jgi:starch phosphorylase
MSELLTIVERLRRLARNLHWTWDPEVKELFRDLDPAIWDESNHNPIAFLNNLSPEEIERRGNVHYNNTRILYAYRRLEEYLNNSGPLGGMRAHCLNAAPVAYFSAEFGLHECLPIYSGGLGLLAGDHLKAASDLGVPLVGVGLLYAQGYFHQRLNKEGWQEETYEQKPTSSMPVTEALDAAGKPLMVSLEMGAGSLTIKVWKVAVGRVTLYLLDTNVAGNSEVDRKLTDRLYGGDSSTRIKQEIVLGVGGLRALRAAGIRPAVLHLNEGHCAFAVLERMRERVVEDGFSWGKAKDETMLQTVFTTHTPVEAGHDRFEPALVEEDLGWMRRALGMSEYDFHSLGRVSPNDPGEPFCMTVLCLKVSLKRNGVANLHGKVSRSMWHSLWPSQPLESVPIGHVTNGVHVQSWMAPVMQRQFEKLLGRDWAEAMSRPEEMARIRQFDEGELWETHQFLKHNLVQFVRERLVKQAALRGEKVPDADKYLDPRALTIGFSRRFATYKRATLLFEDVERLLKIVNHAQKPVQFIFAGKAHPRDEGGKRLIQSIVAFSQEARFNHRLVFLEDYDIGIARTLVQGVDVWLNNPERPLEACGTSGMKVAMNGNLNCSILDGWWAEGFDGGNGFAIGNGIIHSDGDVQRKRDSADLYDVLEKRLVPLYYDRGLDGLPRQWARMMKHTLLSLSWRFSAARMVSDYMRESYLPAAGATSCDMGSGQPHAGL